jgi:hypothetical protein
VTAFDIITELMLLALPIHLVWGLQMPRTKKAMIVIAFYLRLPVLAFSVARSYCTSRLSDAATDPSEGSGLVIIWMTVELAYALAASTLSALKAFTESFNSGFGLTFTRNEGSYGMSNVSGSSGRSNKTEKSKSALDSSAAASRIGSITPAPKADIAASVSPVSPVAEAIEEQPLRLRPEPEIKSFTEVSAGPGYYDYSTRHNDGSTSSGSTAGDDLVILRESAYEVQHDEAPILQAHLRG